MEMEMTLKEAKEQGWKYAFTSWQRGYVTRKPQNDEDIRVYAGGGCRRGLLYYLQPSGKSTQFCHRVYLMKVGD
jgi:hypothetical protein